jgi:DNA gyrase subunit A
VADPEATLLTACANGYGKRTPFGPNQEVGADQQDLGGEAHEDETLDAEPHDEVVEADEEEEGEEGDEHSSQRSYRTQRRGGKGLHDIKTTERNGPVVGISRVKDDDELLMMTARGKIQRIPVSDVSIIGRNTQGVKIMSLDEDDTLVAVKRVPQEASEEKVEEEGGKEKGEGEMQNAQDL